MWSSNIVSTNRLLWFFFYTCLRIFTYIYSRGPVGKKSLSYRFLLRCVPLCVRNWQSFTVVYTSLAILQQYTFALVLLCMPHWPWEENEKMKIQSLWRRLQLTEMRRPRGYFLLETIYIDVKPGVLFFDWSKSGLTGVVRRLQGYELGWCRYFRFLITFGAMYHSYFCHERGKRALRFIDVFDFGRFRRGLQVLKTPVKLGELACTVHDSYTVTFCPD